MMTRKIAVMMSRMPTLRHERQTRRLQLNGGSRLGEGGNEGQMYNFKGRGPFLINKPEMN